MRVADRQVQLAIWAVSEGRWRRPHERRLPFVPTCSEASAARRELDSASAAMSSAKHALGGARPGS